MKFFIPHAKDETEAESVLNSIVSFIGATIPAPRIYSIEYTHNGKSMTATVGEDPDTYYQEAGPVIAILYRPGCYTVCLPNRGVLRGDPILVGQPSVNAIVHFE